MRQIDESKAMPPRRRAKLLLHHARASRRMRDHRARTSASRAASSRRRASPTSPRASALVGGDLLRHGARAPIERDHLVRSSLGLERQPPPDIVERREPRPTRFAAPVPQIEFGHDDAERHAFQARRDRVERGARAARGSACPRTPRGSARSRRRGPPRPAVEVLQLEPEAAPVVAGEQHDGVGLERGKRVEERRQLSARQIGAREVDDLDAKRRGEHRPPA